MDWNNLTPEQIAFFKSMQLPQEEREILKSRMWTPFAKVPSVASSFTYTDDMSADKIKLLIKGAINYKPEANTVKSDDGTVDVHIIRGVGSELGQGQGQDLIIVYYVHNAYSICTNKFTKSLEIYMINVPPSMQNKGIAKFVLDELEADARRNGIKELSVRAVMSPILGDMLTRRGFITDGLLYCKVLSGGGGGGVGGRRRTRRTGRSKKRTSKTRTKKMKSTYPQLSFCVLSHPPIVLE